MTTLYQRTALIVEDEPLIRMHGADILQDAGFKVLEADGADEAVAIIEQHGNVDLVFSDVDMPGTMNGIELLKYVHGRWPRIRLLLTSGHRLVVEADLPTDGRFIRKPWTAEVLAGKAHAICETGVHPNNCGLPPA